MEITAENGGFHRDRCVLCDGKGPWGIPPGALLHQISECNEHAVLQVLDPRTRVCHLKTTEEQNATIDLIVNHYLMVKGAVRHGSTNGFVIKL